jgi:hypothetical protein
VGTVNSVMTPAGVIRPILFDVYSVNQRLPSDPAAIPFGVLDKVGTAYSWIVPRAVGTEADACAVSGPPAVSSIDIPTPTASGNVKNFVAVRA